MILKVVRPGPIGIMLLEDLLSIMQGELVTAAAMSQGRSRSLGEVVCESENKAGIGTPELIDALGVITNGKQPESRISDEELNQPELRSIYVLILINQQMLRSLLELGKKVRVVLQNPTCEKHLIIEVDAVASRHDIPVLLTDGTLGVLSTPITLPALLALASCIGIGF